jgi:molybdopterin-guanine dinucleotide biosynthesis protein A
MTAAAILAGGQARRLGGVSKPLLSVGGRRIVDRQIEVLRPLFDTIVLVTAEPAAFADLRDAGVDVVSDRVGPGWGPLAGVDAALAWLPREVRAVVCVAGDMPFLAPSILRRLRDAPAAQAVVPRRTTGPEPLCARYDRRLTDAIANALAQGTRALHLFLESLADVSWIDEDELRRLDPALRTFTNINTAADLSAVTF